MSDNPCLRCTISQGCCTDLKGLRLSAAEYERHFADFGAALEVRRHGGAYRVTSKAGRCPNWQGQCQVYETRPMECRLYPYTVSHIAAVGDDVQVVMHNRTGCPQKAALTPPQAEAEALVRGYVAEVFGADARARVIFDPGGADLGVLAVKIAAKVVGPG
jgi:Fe-S-cluster containining protein